MTCPNCGFEPTKVTNTYPGAVVTRRHRCLKCNATWKSEQRAIAATIAISAPLVATQPLLVTTSITEPAPFLSDRSLPGLRISDPSPISPGNPIRARTRKAKAEPKYEPEFLRIWVITGKRGNKFKAQESWISVGRPSFEVISAKWGEYKASLEHWQTSTKHLVTWLNQWGHTQDYVPAPPPPVRRGPVPIAVAVEEARAERIIGERQRRITEELKPRQSAPSPREQFRASQGGKQ